MDPVQTKRVGERLDIWTNCVMEEKFLGEFIKNKKKRNSTKLTVQAEIESTCIQELSAVPLQI